MQTLRGEFIFIFVWAIRMTSCFIYRCPRVCRSGRSSGVSRRSAAGAARTSWPGRGCERREEKEEEEEGGGAREEERREADDDDRIDDFFPFLTHGARSSRR